MAAGEVWQHGAHRAADDGENPDSDPYVNLVEYAFAQEPATPDLPGTPAISINAGGYLQVAFPRHADRTDLRYLVEATSDLTLPWTVIARSIHGAPAIAAGAHSCVETGTGELRLVVVEDTAPVATFSQRFLRVRVVRD